MDNQKFDQLVSQLEQSALSNPQLYFSKVMLVAILGFLVLGVAVLFALVPLAVLLGLVFIVVITGGKALIVLLKLGKLLILLLLPAWVMVKTSAQMLFTRFPKPAGRELTPSEAPTLFARLTELKQRLRGPAIHKVLLTQELNAAIVQHPRFGLFGWEENYLILGMPLLQTISENEALAVVAHEYGHLSGYHSRLGGFIYRFRLAWSRLQSISEQWRDWGSRVIARMFRWYAPYFNAYTFVYARQNEYIADSTSVEVAGAHDTANALLRINIAAQLENEVFWPELNKLIHTNPEPIDSRSGFWNDILKHKLDEAERIRYLEVASKYQTNNLDTHPCLTDRLQAIGINIQPEKARDLLPPARTAAESWFGSSYERILGEFDQKWREDISTNWRERHAYLGKRQQQQEELEAKPQATPDERWELIEIYQELRPDTDHSALINAYADEFPEHLPARYRRGILRLGKQDDNGIVDLEFVMAADKKAILPCCEAAWRYYLESQPAKAEEYRQRWVVQAEFLEKVQAEFASLPSNAELSMHELDAETEEKIRNLIAQDKKYIRKVYLLRRVLKSDSSQHDYVLAFETSSWTLGDKSPAVLKRLVSYQYPVSMYVVNLKSTAYKSFIKQIKKLKIPPLIEN